MVSEQAQVIRTSLSEIRSTGRATQGVRIFNPKQGDKVASISCVGQFEVPEEKVVAKAPSAPVAPPAPESKRNGGPPATTERLFE